MTPDQAQAINYVQSQLNAYEILKVAITGEHKYYYQALLVTDNDSERLLLYGGYLSTKNIMESFDMKDKVIQLTDNIRTSLKYS